MESKTSIVSLAAWAYLTTVCAVYVVGYWGAIGVNVFPFMGVPDVYLAAAKSLIYIVSVLFVSILYAMRYGSVQYNDDNTFTVSDIHEHRMRKYFSAVFLTALIVYEAYKYLAHFWFAPIALFVLIWIYTNIRDCTIAQRIIPSIKARDIILYMVCMLPLYAYWNGVSDAYDVLNNINYSYIYAENLEIKSKAKNVFLLKYAGSIGSTHVFLTMNNESRFVYQPKDGFDLDLRRYPK